MTRPKSLPKQYSTEWFRDLEPGDDKELRKQLIGASSKVLEILADILKKKRESLEKKYDYAEGWEFNIARDIGRKEELDFVIKLVTPVIEKE